MTRNLRYVIEIAKLVLNSTNGVTKVVELTLQRYSSENSKIQL